METNNFDNQIKEQLEQRKLEPSAKSWEQLRAKLDKEDKNSGSIYRWLSIAASLVAGILIVNLVFNTTKETGSPMLVNETHNTPEVDYRKNLIPNTINKTTFTDVPEDEEIQIVSLENKNHPSKSTLSEEENKAESLPKEKVLDSNILSEEDFPPKIYDIITVAATEKNHEHTTEDEVDALLREAAEQLYLEKRYKESVSTINANSLLQSVETELNQTFREKIFELLKDGYLKTKNAVAIKTN